MKAGSCRTCQFWPGADRCDNLLAATPNGRFNPLSLKSECPGWLPRGQHDQELLYLLEMIRAQDDRYMLVGIYVYSPYLLRCHFEEAHRARELVNADFRAY